MESKKIESSGDPGEQIDVVYTWVDDAQPGYLDVLNRYADSPQDRAPNRTRDTLETLRYSMRSLEVFAPWINRIHLLTCRPQVPHWLRTDHPKLNIVHHDQIMAADILPTFNSFAIVSHLHLIPGLTKTFLYLEDDILLLSPVSLDDFRTPEFKTLVFQNKHISPTYAAITKSQSTSHWNLALAECNRLLDERYGPSPLRRQVNHVPLLIDLDAWAALVDTFPDAVHRTRASRFREAGNIALEYLYLRYLLAEGRAELAAPVQVRASAGYVPLENAWVVTAIRLFEVMRRHPKWVTLNDNFGDRPSRICMSMMRRALQAWLPDPCSLEL